MIQRFVCIISLFCCMTSLHAQIKFNEVQTSNASIKDPDYQKSGDWIEIYNGGSSSVNLKGYFITDNKDKPRKWEFKKDFTIAAGKFAVVWCDGNDYFGSAPHTNFKISSAGEAIRLYSNTMLLVDSVKVPLVERAYSYGRTTDGTGSWALLKKVTAGASNNNSGHFLGMAPQPKFSVKGGWYNSNQNVTISCDLAGATIRYTTDGSEPTSSSPIYTPGTVITAEKKNAETQKSGYNYGAGNTAIMHAQNWPTQFTSSSKYSGKKDYNFVLKAKAFHNDYMTSNTSGETYFINERRPTLPVISLSIDKKYLFSADSGLYIKGTNGATANYGGGNDKYNWAQDWAYPAHIEFYDKNGVKQFDNTATIEVFGSASRSFDLKSLAVKVKHKYENAEIKYPIFGDDALPTYQSFVLRNSGNDWADGNFARDAIIQQIIRGQVDLETQDYQPVVLFINGEYWSLMNVRERLSAEYFAGYHDYAENIDLLKIGGKNSAGKLGFYDISEGTADRYDELINLLGGSSAYSGTKKDLSSNQALYDNIVTNYIDKDNIINYYIAQTYCDNGDWPHNNARMWRPRVGNGKFRFPLYDTDFGYGLWGNSNSTFDNALSDNFYKDGESRTWSTVIFRSLLTKPEFKAEFIQRYAYMLNTVYSDNRMTAIADPIEQAISSERDMYTNQGWVRNTNYSISSMKLWNSGRRGSIRSSLSSKFGNQFADYTVQYSTSQGKVQLCGLDVANNYTGQQMLNIPIRMTATPKDGYQFKHWENSSGTVLSTSREYSYTMTAASTIKAVFESRANLAAGNLRINELMASNNATIATEYGRYTDWFEIYNPGTASINIAGLYVSDNAAKPDKYQIPYDNAAATTIAAKGFLLLWADKDTYSGITHLPFKLSKDGGVILISQKKSDGSFITIDQLTYGGQNTDISYGRYPDGSASNIITFEKPTPNATNEIKPDPEVSGIYITEILAKNSSINKEETGNYADWFELYNSNTEAVDLGGLYVTNDFKDYTMYQIPRGESAKTTIPAGGYMILWADKQTAINPNHVDFKLNAEKGQIALVQMRGSQYYVIDSISYRNSGEDVSYGRYPNNTSAFRYLATPTPAVKNVNTATKAAVSGITINEILAENTGILQAEDGKYYDYIELYNAGSTAVDLGGLFISDDLSYSLRYRIKRNAPSETTIPAKGWLTLFASDSASLGARHLSFALDKGGEAVVLAQVSTNGLEIIDSKTFGAQTTNISFGRFPETVNNWEVMEPTPTAANISANSSVNLKTITASQGTISPAVAKGVEEYVCFLPASVTTAPVISATAINANATVVVTQASSVNGKAKITVTAANGSATADYYVSFANDPSGDASLKSLTVNVGSLSPAFSSTVYAYTLTFSSSTKPLFTAIANSSNAKVEILYGARYSEPTIVRVTSENNTVQNYTITYQSNPLELTQWVDDFSNGIGNVSTPSSQYVLSDRNGKLQIRFKRGATDADSYFEYHLPENTVINASGKDLYVTFIGYSLDEDGVTNTGIGVRNRVIDFYGYEASNRPYNSDEALSVQLTKKTYETDFANTGTADKSRIAGVRFVLDANNTSSQKNKLMIIEKIVIGPKLEDVKNLSANADLAALSTSVGVLSPTFNAATMEYTVTLPAGTTAIPTISASKADAKANLKISQAASLTSDATITVTSENLLVTNNYIVHFVVNPSIVDGLTDQILQPALTAWSETSALYDLSYSAGVLNIAYTRSGAGSDYIQYSALAGENKILNLTNYPYVSVKAKSSVATSLRADIFDNAGNTATVAAQAVASSTTYNVYTFDFSSVLSSVSASSIQGVRLYFDAGTTAAKQGSIGIDELRFGSDVEIRVNAAPVISAIPAQTVEQSQAFTPIALNTYVTDDNTPVANLVWTVSAAENFTVSLVNNVATVTPKSATWIGSEQITFTVTDEDGATATRRVRFTVTELIIPVEDVSFAQASLTLLLGESRSFASAVTINPSNASDKTISYASSNPLVLSINETTGVASALQEGTVTLTITSANGKTAQCTITVAPILASSITAIPTAMIMTEGESTLLAVEIVPDNTTNKTVAWTSNNPSVATIVASNSVRAVSEGTATLTATTTNGLTATCEVTVNKLTVLVESISLPAALDLEVGAIQKLTVDFTPANADNKTLTWSSSAPAVASVNSDGIVTAAAIGTAVITAQTMNNKTASITITVQGINPTSVVLSKNTLTLFEGDTETIEATIYPTSATDKSIVWTSSSNAVATVDNGTITAVSEGTTTITASSHNGKTATCTVTVNPIAAQSVTLSETQVKLSVGEKVQITATVLPANTSNKTTTWTIANESIALLDQYNRIAAINEGTTTLTVSTENGKTATCTITVEEVEIPVESIHIAQSAVSVNIDETFDFTVTFIPENVSNTTVLWTSSSPTVATVSGGTVTALMAGTTEIQARTANGKIAIATLTVNPMPVASITLSETAVQLSAGESATITATILPAKASDKTIVWTSSASGIATVDNGVITAVAPGNATITATGSNGKTATVVVTVQEVVANNILLPSEAISIPVGGSEQINVSFVPANTSNKTITWTVSDPAIVQVSASGEVQALAAGTATLTARSANGKTATCTVTVVDVAIPITEISLPAALAIDIDETAAPIVTFTPQNASNKTITWTSSSNTIATVSAEGIITGKTAGTAVITARSVNNKTAAVIITVNPMLAESVTLSQIALSLVNGSTTTLTATIMPANTTNQSITWTSSNPAVASIVNGEITALSVGTTTITATTSNGKTTTCTITVTPVLAQSVSFSVSTLELAVGQAVNLEATVLPANTANKSVTYSITNPLVASIDQNGLVTALAAGTAQVTATTANGKTATCNLSVTEVEISVTSVTILGESGSAITVLSLDKDDEYQFTALVTPTNATNKTITWTSSNTAVASIVNGKLVTLSDGTTQITAQSANGITSRVTVTVLPVQVTAISLQPQYSEVFVGEQVNIVKEVLPTNAKIQTVTWSSSNENIAIVNNNGRVTTLSEGTVVITARSVGNTAITGTTTIVVKPIVPQTITITNDKPAVKVDESLQLTHSVYPAAANQSALWLSSNPSVCTVSATGVITGVSVGTATITATTSNGKTSTVVVTVNPVVPSSVTLSPSTITVTVGNRSSSPIFATVLPANATNKALSWTIDHTDIASIDAAGYITGISVGTARLTVQAQSGEARAYCSITVNAEDVELTAITIKEGGSEIILPLEQTLLLNIQKTPANATDQSIVWTVSNSSIVSVTQGGMITALSPGTAVITATAANGVKTSKTIRVPEQEAEEVIINEGAEGTLKMTAGTSLQLTATVKPENTTNKSLTWSLESNTGAISINQEGVVQALKPGYTIVKVATSNGLETALFIEVEPLKATAITLGSNPTNIFFNQQVQINFQTTPTNADKSTVTWSSSDPSIATVDKDGIIHTYTTKGDVIFTATLNNGNTYTYSAYVSKYSEAPKIRTISEQKIKQGGTFNPLELSQYFTPYIDPETGIAETLIFDHTPNTGSKFSVSVASNGKCTITVLDPTWSGTEPITVKARNAEGGLESSITVIVTVTQNSVAINEVPKTSFTAFPTVTQNYTTLIISPAVPTTYTLAVYDIEGKLIQKEQLTASETTQKIIDFTNMPRGVYTCVLTSKKTKQNVKIVVE
ncbi:MAG: Ig-like domain-containing protein [Bacteroidales bacterium]|nr:Ig-like domain-containing protein [Bacteroidales bacterium]